MYRVPVANYVASVSESFPRPEKDRSMECGMERRFELTVTPSNASNTGYGRDGYIEFRIPGCGGQFIDLSTLILNLTGHVTKASGEKVGMSDGVRLANIPVCTLFKSIYC